MTQRDRFFNTIIESNTDFIIITTDFGCVVFDKIKNTNKLINVGAQEQLAITIATGLSLCGKIVYVYGIAPFISLRALEQIRVSICSQKLPITIVGVGSGLSYDIAGLTHHGTEDLNIMRCLPNMTVVNISSIEMAKYYAQKSLEYKTPLYIRLDKKQSNYNWKFNDDYGWLVRKNSKGDCPTIISTGELCNYLQYNIPEHYGLIEVYKFPCETLSLQSYIKYNCKKLISIEESYQISGLGDYLASIELNHKKIAIKNFCESKPREEYYNLLLGELLNGSK